MKKSYQNFAKRPGKSADHEAVGARVREIRHQRGLSMRDVASRGGPAVATQCQAESGLASVTIETLSALANVFDCEVVEFFCSPNNGTDIEVVCACIRAMPQKEIHSLRERLERKVLN